MKQHTLPITKKNRHSRNSTQYQKPCKFFNSASGCFLGENCPYQHQKVPSVNQPPDHIERVNLNQEKENNPSRDDVRRVSNVSVLKPHKRHLRKNRRHAGKFQKTRTPRNRSTKKHCGRTQKNAISPHKSNACTVPTESFEDLSPYTAPAEDDEEIDSSATHIPPQSIHWGQPGHPGHFQPVAGFAPGYMHPQYYYAPPQMVYYR